MPLRLLLMVLVLLSLMSAQGWHHVLPSGHHHHPQGHGHDHEHQHEPGHDHSFALSQTAMRQDLGPEIAASAAVLAPLTPVQVEPPALPAAVSDTGPPVSARREPPRPQRGPPSRA